MLLPAARLESLGPRGAGQSPQEGTPAERCSGTARAPQGPAACTALRPSADKAPPSPCHETSMLTVLKESSLIQHDLQIETVSFSLIQEGGRSCPGGGRVPRPTKQ